MRGARRALLNAEQTLSAEDEEAGAEAPSRAAEAVADRATSFDMLLERLRTSAHPSAMVARTSWLTRRFLTWVLASVVLAQRCIDSLRDLQTRGAVVHIMRTRSLLDYLYFNVAFEREGIRPARLANGLNTWMLRPFGAALIALVRRTAGFPPEADCLRVLARAGESATLFLQRGRTSDEQDTADTLPLLEALLDQQAAQTTPILCVPLLLVWEKRPERHRPTLLDGVFGSRQSPGFFKKLWYVLQNFWQSFLHLGAPTVQVSSAIDLRTFRAENGHLSLSAMALALRDRLADALEREERVIVGPWVKSARQMRDEILADPRVRNDLARLEITLEVERTELIERSRAILREVAADFNLLAIKFFSAALTPIWNQIYDGFEVDHDGLDRLRDLATRKRIVLVPSHKSHIDYLVLSYVFYQNGLIPPHIAAGLNLSFWPLGPLFRRSGAFFLRRSFTDDPLYRALFNAYLVKLLEEGFAIEFFIEGTRSRTGKLNAPRYGMLNMIVEAFRSGDVDALAFVPVSVGYEKIIEGTSYRKELEGEEKRSEGIGDLLKTSAVLRSRYGRVYVEFGQPIDLGDFLGESAARASAVPRDTDLARTVRRLAYAIVHGINDATAVTPSAIAALVLLNDPGDSISDARLLGQAAFVLCMLRDRGARLSRTLRDAMGQLACDNVITIESAMGPSLREAVALFEDDRLVTSAGHEDGTGGWAVPRHRRAALAYYRNSILHFFVPEAVLATALALVRADEAPCLKDKCVPIPHEDLVERVRFLSRLFKYEFCFEARDQLAVVLERTLVSFEERNWIRRSAEGIEATGPPPAPGFEFLRALLLPTLESYRLAADAMLESGAEWVEHRTLVGRALQLGRQKLRDNALRHPEAIARPTVETAIRLLSEWQLLETRRVTRARRSVRELRVGRGTAPRMLQDLVQQLRAAAQQQHRDPDDALDGPASTPNRIPRSEGS